MRYAYFLTNGILTHPGDSHNWTGRGVTHIQTSHAYEKGMLGMKIGAPIFDCAAEKVEYFCSALTRAFWNKERASKLYNTCRFYHAFTNIHVAHSNGCDVFVDMLKMFGGETGDLAWPNIEHAHLVCGACDADFERNGLNLWLRLGRIKYITVYVAGKDMAMRLAGNPIGKLLGYGCLGANGPLNVADDVRERVSEVRWEPYRHSDCWKPENFENTMELFKPEACL